MDYFLPLGGANEIGASAYYLSIDGVKILLDCGARIKGEEQYPDYSRLKYEMLDYSEIDIILISHGHYDHIGSFAWIVAQATNAEIICTADTKSLIYLQLLGFGRISGRAESVRVKNERYRQAVSLVSRIKVESVMRPFTIKNCKITFMPAGHMLGAVMIDIESQNHHILYSGDFSTRTMFGVNGLKMLPNLQVDTLLLNASNAYQTEEEWKKLQSRQDDNKKDYYETLCDKIREQLQRGKNVYIVSHSVPKHLDLFYLLKDQDFGIPVYMEEPSKKIADALSEMGYRIYDETIRPAFPQNVAKQHICIGNELEKTGYSLVQFDGYSLHVSPLELMDFIRNLQPIDTYLLHTYTNYKKKSIADILKQDGYTRKIIQGENGKKYYLKKENDMKYIEIYREELRKELPRAKMSAEKQELKGKLLNEWIAVYGSMKNPESHPKEAFDRLPKKLTEDRRLSYTEYLEALKNANLDSVDKRRYVLQLVEKGVSLLKEALDGNKEAATAFDSFVGNLAIKDINSHKLFFIGKATLVFMIFLDPDLKDEEFAPIAVNFGARFCNTVLWHIRDHLFREYHLTKKRRSAKDMLQATETAIKESAENAGTAKSGNELERLRFENENYRNSLELVQSMLDELKETIDETAADAKNGSVASFYTQMNSDAYGNLLDSIELVEERLADLRAKHVKTPPQFLPLAIVFKQLVRFINDCGVLKIDTRGRVFETEAEGLAEFTYIGAPFTEAGERKKVRVEKSGWKYNNLIISLPTVREVEEEEE